MSYVISYLQDFNIISILFRLFLAAVLSGIIGYERSKNGRAAGLRTHMLVCLGATLISMTGLHIGRLSNDYGDISRMAAQIVSGIGFLGAGTILVKNKSIVTGLTTAACVWATGALGIAIGYGFYIAAIAGALLVFFTASFMGELDDRIRRKTMDFNIYVEFYNATLINNTLTKIKNSGLNVEMVNLCPAKSNTPNGIGAEIVIKILNKKDIDTVIQELHLEENVKLAILSSKIY